MPVQFAEHDGVTLIAMSLDDILSSIDSEIAQLRQARALLGGIATGTRGRKAGVSSTKPKRKLSAAAREQIAAAQRKRWAATKKAARNIPVKVAKEATAPAKKIAKLRKLSAKTRKAIADAQRKRWAKVKAEKAAKKVPAKKAARKAPAKKATAKPKKAAPKKAPAAKAKKAAPEKATPAATEAAPF